MDDKPEFSAYQVEQVLIDTLTAMDYDEDHDPEVAAGAIELALSRLDDVRQSPLTTR